MIRIKKFNENRTDIIKGLEFIEVPVDQKEIKYSDHLMDKVKDENLYNIRIFLESSDDVVANDFYVYESDIENFYKLFKKTVDFFNLDWNVDADTVKKDRRYWECIKKFRNLIKKKSFLAYINRYDEWIWTGRRFVVK